MLLRQERTPLHRCSCEKKCVNCDNGQFSDDEDDSASSEEEDDLLRLPQAIPYYGCDKFLEKFI